jgi:hypothetical protein
MTKIIGFYDNQLNERGTTVALFDYAYYNETILNNKSIIFYERGNPSNNDDIIKKFKKYFKVFDINNYLEVDKIVEYEKIDLIYWIKSGENDNKLSHKCKNVVHCVFNCYQPHGDVYASIGPWIDGNNGNFSSVPHMVYLPDHNKDMRTQLNIPQNSLVFGRYGATYNFGLTYVHHIIYKVAQKNPNIYFLFANTDKFCEPLPNIIHLPTITDTNKKVEFINTCDAMIWAGTHGETFGLSIAEFSIRNKPIICTKIGWLGYIHLLGDKAILYNEDTLEQIFLSFNREESKLKDWNAYTEYTPEKVMKIFNNVFLKILDVQSSIQSSIQSLNVHPISFAIPISCIVDTINTKKKYMFSPLIPGKINTYIYNTEKDYYKQYNQSFYAITTIKAGWDCLRHYEILANSCIPYFPDLEKCPINTMFNFPKSLILEAMNLPGVSYNSIDFSIFPIEKYFQLANKLLEYTKNNLTTVSLAKYVLNTVGIGPNSKILFLSGDINPDYQRCLLLHGFKEILGDSVVDHPTINHMYDDYENSLNLYGKGFSYSKRLDHKYKSNFNISDLTTKKFDYIIYGSMHRGLPYYDVIEKIYDPKKIIMICGEDKDMHSPCQLAPQYQKHNIFIREMN